MQKSTTAPMNEEPTCQPANLTKIVQVTGPFLTEQC